MLGRIEVKSTFASNKFELIFQLTHKREMGELKWQKKTLGQSIVNFWVI